VENKKYGQGDATEACSVVPLYFLTEIQDGENREHREGYDFLNRLQLRRAEFVRADAIGRNLEAVFEKGDPPAHENDFPKSGSAELQVAIPGESHEDIRDGQKDDGSHVFPVLSLGRNLFLGRRGTLGEGITEHIRRANPAAIEQCGGALSAN
jgi:hypothetical protein